MPTLVPSTPTAVPQPPRSRRTPWVVALAVALVVGTASAVALRALDDAGSGSEEGRGGGRPPTASASTGAASVEVAEYIVNDRISRDYWTLSDEPDEAAYGVGECRQVGAVPPAQELQYSVSDADDPGSPTVSERVEIAFRFKSAQFGARKPEPYHVSVGVKPPHEIDADTGWPYEVMTESKNIGYTSKPVDIYTHWKTGGYIELTYPDDFRSHFPNGKTYPPIPVANDPGDWTAVLYHVKGGPSDYESIGCTGFRVGNS